MSERIWNKRWPWVLAALVVVAIYLSTVLDVYKSAEAQRPAGGVEEIESLAERSDLNILYILIDTLRSERLGCYGYGRNTSPLIDELANDGVLFDRHRSQSSWTKCSMASLWTGLYPQRSGVTRFEHTIPDEAVLPAEILRDAGFRTVGIFRNGWVEGYFGFDQGFESYSKPVPAPVPPTVRRENPTMKVTGTDDSAVASAIEFLRINGDQRWFLYMHLMDVHEYLYSDESAKFGTGISDIYDNSILHTNYVLETLFTYLEQRELLGKTLIVIGSDHGEAFGERGLEGHARAVYRESTEVPFIISFPFSLETPLRITKPTYNVDVWPTILDLLGLPALEDTDGRSRVPEILAAARGESTPPDEPGFAHLDQNWGQRKKAPAPTVSVTDEDYRFVLTRPRSAGIEERAELYHSSRERAELEDVIEAEPETAARLREVAEKYLEQKPPWEKEAETLEIDEVQLNQLRALGYQVP